MPAPIISSRRGMTLIELMVVVAILGLLSVIVLPTLSATTDSRRYREAARNVSAFIARSQSRAIGAAELRGVIFQPLAADPDSSIDLFFADTPESYCGETTTSSAVLQLPTNVTAGPLQITFDPLTLQRLQMDQDFCQLGDQIRFGTSGPYFKFIPPDKVAMWVEDNQNPRNTAWPRATGIGLPYRIRRQPVRASTGTLQTQSAGIDIAWSCIGSRPLSQVLDPSKRDRPITLLFDASGKPSEIVHSGGIRTTIGEPLFLLIGAIELSGNPYAPSISGQAGVDPERRSGANWQYPDCVWLCVDNNSGVVKFGPVKPQATNVIESQLYIRQTIGLSVSER